jgi:hypothetical protein
MFLLLASFSLCLSLYAATHPLETPQGYVFTSFWSSAILTALCSSLLLLQTYLGGGSSQDADLEKSAEGGRTVGFLPRTTTLMTTNGRNGFGLWWRRIFGVKEKQRAVADGGTRSRFGAASISVMVEVFSRVETIEDAEEFTEEVKPQYIEPGNSVR